MEKRGQFFLVSSLVIIGILLGLSTIYNTANFKKEDKIVYDLSKEINYEASQVIDSGVFNSLSGATIEDNLNSLTNFYSDSYPQQDFLVLYGNEKKLKVLQYKNTDSGAISVSLGGTTVEINQNEKETLEGEADIENCKKDSDVEECRNRINLELSGGGNYTFRLRPGQFFYVIIKKEKADETFVAVPQLSPKTEKQVSSKIKIDLK